MTWLQRQYLHFKQDFLANQRLRLGIFVIAVLALIYLFLVLDDMQDVLLADFHKLSSQQHELISLEPHDVWQQRVSEQAVHLEKNQIAIWQADSEGLARANLQSRITQYAEMSDLRSFNMRVGSFQPHGDLEGVETVILELDAAYVSDRVLDFINALESSTPLLKIERISIRNGTRNNRAKITILMLFRPS